MPSDDRVAAREKVARAIQKKAPWRVVIGDQDALAMADAALAIGRKVSATPEAERLLAREGKRLIVGAEGDHLRFDLEEAGDD